MVNAVVVQRKIMSLPGEICLPKLPNGIGGTEPAKVRVNRAEVSRGRELNEFVEERSEGSARSIADGFMTRLAFSSPVGVCKLPKLMDISYHTAFRPFLNKLVEFSSSETRSRKFG
jgi:hypothetical protein